MRLLLLNQFFHPDLSATAQLATDLAEDLAAAGIEVTALAARGAYLGGGRLPAVEEYPVRPSTGSGRTDVGFVRIERVRSTALGKGSLARRLVDYGTFTAAAAARALTKSRHDVVLAMSTPPSLAAIAASVGALRGTPFVYWLQDVYPELAVEFGVVREGSAAARAAGALSRWALRRAAAVVVLGEAMAERVRAKGVDPARVHVVPNWADGAQLRPIPPEENAFRRAHGLGGKSVALHSGNMGRAHDLRTLVGVVRALAAEPDLVFLFVGDGARRAEVEAAARDLPAIRLLPYQPRERLAESLSAGDVHLVTQEPFTVGLVEPSKLYGAMAVGRPVLYLGPAGTEAARTVEREGIGEVVANGDPAAAAAALLRLLREREVLGARARAAFEARYDRPRRTAQLVSIVCAVARSGSEPDLHRKK